MSASSDLHTQLFIPYKGRYEADIHRLRQFDPLDSRHYSLWDSGLAETCVALLDRTITENAVSADPTAFQQAADEYEEIQECLRDLRYSGDAGSVVKRCLAELKTLRKIAKVCTAPCIESLESLCKGVASDLENEIRAEQQSRRDDTARGQASSYAQTRLVSLQQLAHDYLTFAKEDTVSERGETNDIVDYWGKEARAILRQHALAIDDFANVDDSGLPPRESNTAVLGTSAPPGSDQTTGEAQTEQMQAESWDRLFAGLATVADMLDSARSTDLQDTAELVGDAPLLQSEE